MFFSHWEAIFLLHAGKQSCFPATQPQLVLLDGVLSNPSADLHISFVEMQCSCFLIPPACQHPSEC